MTYITPQDEVDCGLDYLEIVNYCKKNKLEIPAQESNIEVDHIAKVRLENRQAYK